jgi:hypothetical protein
VELRILTVFGAGNMENEMKNPCIRLRGVLTLNKPYQANQELTKKEEEQLLAKGYKKVFDTIKTDFQYNNSEMKSKVQLQDIIDTKFTKSLGAMISWL